MQGDIWYPDKCTECNCNSGVVSCQKTECPVLDTICEENMTPVLVNGTEERCCAKYLCGELTASLKSTFLIYVCLCLLKLLTQKKERERIYFINYLLIVYILSCVYIFEIARNPVA